MATINLCEVLILFQNSEHYATSYEIYDGNTNEIIDSTYKNENAVRQWKSPLLRPDGRHHRDKNNLRARFKMHFRDDTESDWYELDSYDQTAIPPIIHKCDKENTNG